MPEDLDDTARYIRRVFDQYEPGTFLTARQIWAYDLPNAPSLNSIKACLIPVPGGFYCRVPYVIGIVASRLGGLDIRELGAARRHVGESME